MLQRRIAPAGRWILSCSRIVRFSSTSSQQASAESQDERLQDLLCTSSNPPTFVSQDIVIKSFPGKGRGVVATTPFAGGDLILACRPLAVLHGPCEEMPDPESLAEGIKAGLKQQQGAGQPSNPLADPLVWLRALHGAQGGAYAHAHAAPNAPIIDPVVNALMREQAPPALTGGELAASGGAATAAADVDVDAVVACNAFGDSFEDLAAADVRGEGASVQSHVGLWPQFSFFNHSCLPNCVHYVTGSTMVVRAVQPIAVGEELTVSYLGREEFSPAPVRQQLLHERYGFTCNCPRCRLEGGWLDAPTRDLLHELYADCKQSLQPRFAQAAAEGDKAALQEIAGDLLQWSHKLHPALQGVMTRMCRLDKRAGSAAAAGQQQPEAPSTMSGALDSALAAAVAAADGAAPAATAPAAADAPAAPAAAAASAAEGEAQDLGGAQAAVLCLEAAVYDFLELAYSHASYSAMLDGGKDAGSLKAVGDPDMLLQLCAQVLEAVSRGSELHVFIAANTLAKRMTELGSNHEATLDAARACEEAHIARYGRVSPQLMVRLVEANARRSQEFL